MYNTFVRYNNLVLLAQRLGGHIGVYDLETTTFRGHPDFGITEVFCFFVSPEGQHATIGSLINPEKPISLKAQEVTGITNAMVANKETWAHRFATMFSNMAKGECWVAGYNNKAFDDPGVQAVNARYGVPISGFQKSFDVRLMHLSLSNVRSKAGTLLEVAASYGVFPKGTLHRAEADVSLTVELLDAIIARHGLEAVLAFIENQARAPIAEPEMPGRAPRAKALPKNKGLGLMLQEFMSKRTRATLEEAAHALQTEEKLLSFEIGKAIDTRTVEAHAFANSAAQAWLCQELRKLDSSLLTQGKLKPIHDALGQAAPAGYLDYIQLRIALLSSGFRWATLSVPRT